MTNPAKQRTTYVTPIVWSSICVILIALVTLAPDMKNLGEQTMYLGRIIAWGFIAVILSIVGATMVIATTIRNSSRTPQEPS